MSRRTGREIVTLLLCSLGLSVFPSDVHGQNAALPAPAQTRSPLDLWREDTLEKALASLRWNTAQRGPLLVVNPTQVRARSVTRNSLTFPPPLPPAPPEGWSLRRIGEHFARREFAVASLTVLAPTEMITLNANPARPGTFADASLSNVSKFFLRSLTPAQRKLAVGEQGIGVNDLDSHQRNMFLAMLPPNTELVTTNIVEIKGGGVARSASGAARLSEDDRMQARLKIQKTTMPFLNYPGRSFSVSLSTDLAGDTFYRLNMPSPADTEHENHTTTAFGVEIRRRSSNKLKPGQIAFDAPALNSVVSLEGAATIGELIRRIARVTQVELYADRRVARLPVWVRGQSARSGDVLQALCLAVTGAFRKVGPAYLLTHDMEGMAAHRIRLAAWDNTAITDTILLNKQLTEAFGKEEVYDSIAYASDNAVPLTSAMRENMKNNRDARDRISIPASALPERVRAAMRLQVEQAIKSDSVIADQSQVLVAENVSVFFVLPGKGAIEADTFLSQPMGLVRRRAVVKPAKPAIAPVQIYPEKAPCRALLVSAKAIPDAASAKLLVESATRHHLNQLWVALTPDNDAAATLERAIAAGKKANIAVWAAPRLLHSTTSTTDEERDRDITGATGEQAKSSADWRRVDTPETGVAVKNWLAKIALVPDLGGISLTDWAAPGYKATPQPGNSTPLTNEAGRFGYTPEMRLAFLRSDGIDPIDVVSTGDARLNTVSLTLPFFPDSDYAPVYAPIDLSKTNTVQIIDSEIQGMRNLPYGSAESKNAMEQHPSRRWDALRVQMSSRFLADLYQWLKAKQAALSVLLRLQTENNYDGNGYFVSWDNPVPPQMPAATGAKTGVAVSQAAQSSSQIMLSAPKFETDASYLARRSYLTQPETPEQRAARWESYRRWLDWQFGTGQPLPPRSGFPLPASSAEVKPGQNGVVLDMTDFASEAIPAALGELLSDKSMLP